LLSVDDRELSVSVSIGVSVFPEHEIEPEELLRAADSALFRAKELGRNQLAVFTPELIAGAETRFTVEQGLRLALKREELELAYQPEVHLGNGEVNSVEALLRWRQPDGRLARPGEFLAIAEQSGLMPEINAWVLERAFRDVSCWHHGGWADARVAINISARQLVDRLFVESILRLLDKWRLPAKCIELELTESVLQTGPGTVAALRALRAQGFGIALDDFGTGYSSLTSLEQLPLSRVKLDAKLVAGIGSSPRATAIARAIIDLCTGLGLEVTAEGIERAEQFAWFANNSRISLQGFLFSEALEFCRVLPFKASFGGKLNDLRLSLPSPRRPTLLAPDPIASRATAKSNR
jgi:EAL domain-containing protein (putative c-di-GMP-specific phosphodiesterase class I)